MHKTPLCICMVDHTFPEYINSQPNVSKNWCIQ